MKNKLFQPFQKFQTHENLYLCPPIRDNDYGNYEDEEITEESALEVPEND